MTSQHAGKRHREIFRDRIGTIGKGCILGIVCVGFQGSIGTPSCTAQDSDTAAPSTQTAGNAGEDEQTYRHATELWRQENEEKLKAPHGWLALIAHAWLSEGENRFGNGPGDAIPVPKDLEGVIRGLVVVRGDRIELRIEPGSGLTVNGEEVDTAKLSIDASRFESNSPDRIEWKDRVTFQLVRRVGRIAIRVRDAHSEAIQNYPGKQWFEADPKYRLQATFQPYESPKSISISNIRGDATPVEIVGYVEFDWEGNPYRLDAMSESAGELFLVFRDLSSGNTTYGPGRFLDVKLPEEGKPIDLDFNRAYNPPCAVSPHTLCPLPPKQNHLPFAILAGEKKPAEFPKK